MKRVYTVKDVAKAIAYITNDAPPCEIDSNDHIKEWCDLACGEFDSVTCWCKWLAERSDI